MIKISALEEVRGNSKELVEKEFKKLTEEILKNYKAKLLYEEEEENELYTKIGEFEVEFNNFKEYIDFCLRYTPDVEVLKPDKLVLDVKEVNDILSYIIVFFREFINKYRIGFNVIMKENINLNVEEYKKGKLSEEEILSYLNEGYVRTKIVLEGRGKDEETVLRNLIYTLEEDNIKVRKVATINEAEKGFEGFVGLDILCKPLDLFILAYKYLPVALSIEEEKLKLSLSDIQDIGNELGGAIFELSHAAVRSLF
ncbi:hypothetical protein [Methanocaldococcus infernus]